MDEIIGLAILYELIDIYFEISDSENKDKRSLAKIFHDAQLQVEEVENNTGRETERMFYSNFKQEKKVSTEGLTIR